MAVPYFEVCRFAKEKLSASNPGRKVFEDELPKGETEGIVYRYVGSPMPTEASGGEVLAEDIVLEICAYAVGPDSSVVHAAAQGIRVAFEGQSGPTTDGEIFQVAREQTIKFSRRLDSGQREQKLGWKFRFYARADV